MAGWWDRLRSRFAGALPVARHTVVLLPSGRELSVREDQTVLEAALDAGLPFPHQCKAAMCTSCRCELLSGQVAPRKPMVPPLSDAQDAAGLILACQCEPRSELRIHVEARGNRAIE